MTFPKDRLSVMERKVLRRYARLLLLAAARHATPQGMHGGLAIATMAVVLDGLCELGSFAIERELKDQVLDKIAGFPTRADVRLQVLCKGLRRQMQVIFDRRAPPGLRAKARLAYQSAYSPARRAALAKGMSVSMARAFGRHAGEAARQKVWDDR